MRPGGSRENWIELERELQAETERFCPSPRPDDFEIHATELMCGRGWCKSIPLEKRLALRDVWLSIAAKYDIKIFYRAIVKKRFEQWIRKTFGSGISINPHVVAFSMVARMVDDWLSSLPNSQLGIFISDENKEIVRDVEKSIRILRGLDGELKLGRIVEKGFFIDSAKSIVLQLCDMCSLTLRKKEESKAGLRDNPLYHRGITLLEPLIFGDNKTLRTIAEMDVLEWITSEEKKEAARDNVLSRLKPALIWSLLVV